MVVVHQGYSFKYRLDLLGLAPSREFVGHGKVSCHWLPALRSNGLLQGSYSVLPPGFDSKHTLPGAVMVPHPCAQGNNCRSLAPTPCYKKLPEDSVPTLPWGFDLSPKLQRLPQGSGAAAGIRRSTSLCCEGTPLHDFTLPQTARGCRGVLAPVLCCSQLGC